MSSRSKEEKIERSRTFDARIVVQLPNPYIRFASFSGSRIPDYSDKNKYSSYLELMRPICDPYIPSFYYEEVYHRFIPPPFDSDSNKYAQKLSAEIDEADPNIRIKQQTISNLKDFYAALSQATCGRSICHPVSQGESE